MNKTQKTSLIWLEDYEGDDHVPLERTEYAYDINGLCGSVEPNFYEAFNHPEIVYSVKDITKFFGYQKTKTVRMLIKRVEALQPQLKEEYRFKALLKPKLAVKKRKELQLPFLNGLDMWELEPKERLEHVLRYSGESTNRRKHYTLSFIAALTTVSSLPSVQEIGLNIQITLREIAKDFILQDEFNDKK